MTDTTTEAFPNAPVDASDILINVIIALLAPMFLSASGGDIAFARMAAIETIAAYRARNLADLIAVAQIIAYGLAALGSLSLSLTDDVSLSMTLRLRNNANALNRSAEQNRRAIRGRHVQPATAATELDAPLYEAAVSAKVAATQHATEARERRQLAQQPLAPTPDFAPASPAPAAPKPTDQQVHAMWASAMTDVAGEYSADLANLPPAERHTASRRAAALSSCATDLLLGTPPERLKPGAPMPPRQ